VQRDGDRGVRAVGGDAELAGVIALTLGAPGDGVRGVVDREPGVALPSGIFAAVFTSSPSPLLAEVIRAKYFGRLEMSER